ncbi:hypothetical protein F5X96DRAFT_670926 [Biscogniauxia mediterranea]|nr:hypothetical protein F5X96DRAFT_670926 [Biscogniauxia mediterranea]
MHTPPRRFGTASNTGDFIGAATARLCAEKSVFLTPLLVTYATMADSKWKGFLPAELAIKNETVLAAGLEGLRIASEVGGRGAVLRVYKSRWGPLVKDVGSQPVV